MGHLGPQDLIERATRGARRTAPCAPYGAVHPVRRGAYCTLMDSGGSSAVPGALYRASHALHAAHGVVRAVRRGARRTARRLVYHQGLWWAICVLNAPWSEPRAARAERRRARRTAQCAPYGAEFLAS